MKGPDDVLAEMEPGPTQPTRARVPRARPLSIALAQVPEPPASAEPEPPFPSSEWVYRVQTWQPPIDLTTRAVSVQYAVEGWIQEAKVGAFVAAGGTGKTTLLLHLAVCHATGRPFFGCKVKQGTFVLLSPDDSQEDLEGALAHVVRAMKLTSAETALVLRKVRLHSLQGESGLKTFTSAIRGDMLATGLEELILEALAGILPDLVGIALDTLRQFCGGSSNDEQVVKLTIAGATELALRSGAYVILPHHTGKQNYRDGVADMYCGSGSAAIADNCRFVLLLQTTTWADIESKVRRTGQERGDPLVLTSTRGSLLVRPPEPMFLHRDGYYFGRVAGAVLSKSQQVDEKDRAVLRAVRQGSQTKNAIAAVIRGNRKAALDRVGELEGRGLLQRGSESGSAKFVLTGSGARFLEAEA